MKYPPLLEFIRTARHRFVEQGAPIATQMMVSPAMHDALAREVAEVKGLRIGKLKSVMSMEVKINPHMPPGAIYLRDPMVE